MPTRSPRRNARSKGRAGRTFYGTAGAAAFDPASLSGKLLWLRAKSQAGANGSTITTWTDESGNSNDATAVSSPTLVTGATPSNGNAVSCTGGNFSTPAFAYAIKAVTASSTAGGGFSAGAAADGDTSNPNWWVSTTNTGWLRFQVSPGTVATNYTIYPRTDLLAQAPRTWTFGGSNDGTTFTTLDTQTGITFAAASQTFSFSNTTGYAYYKLDVTANNGNANLTVADFQINGASNVPPTAVEGWAVVKVASMAVDSGLWWVGQTSDNSGNEGHFPLGTGVVYENFGLGTGNRQSFTPTVALTSWRLYRVRNDGTTWQAWLDNTSQGNASTKPVKWTTTPRIGHNGASVGLNGQLAEVLILNRVCTTQEVTDLIAYFNTEHGLTVT